LLTLIFNNGSLRPPDPMLRKLEKGISAYDHV